jgi:hypothetical protein
MRPTPLVLLVSLAGCVTTAPAVSSGVRLRPETRPECEALCRQMDLRLSAVVLIQDTAGCVCEPGDRPAGATAGPAAVTGQVVLAARVRDRAQEQQRREEAERAAREADEQARRAWDPIPPAAPTVPPP